MSDSALQAIELDAGVRRPRPAIATVGLAVAFGRTRVGIAIVVVLGLAAVFGPFFAPHSTVDFVGPPYAKPSSESWLGTDYLGRDVLSRFLSGGRLLLGLSVAATALGVAAAVGIGLAAAYFRPRVDDALMRLMDVLMAFPPIVLTLLVITTIGPKLWLLILAVAGVHAPRVARLVRGAALEIVERDFVKAAEAIGETRRSVLFREILPNVMAPLLAETSLRLTYSIGIVASLSFLGFGLQPPASDWGLMINENRSGVTIQPWPVVSCVAAIGLLTIGTNLVADGLSRAIIGIERKRAAT